MFMILLLDLICICAFQFVEYVQREGEGARDENKNFHVFT